MRIKLPSRGKWIAARAAQLRGLGFRSLDAVKRAADDWDTGAKCDPPMRFDPPFGERAR